MKRDLLKNLYAWRESAIRQPLILRGARQVGKSWLIEEFGKQFSSCVSVNFEKDKSASLIFEGDIRIKDIIEKLSIYTQTKIIPGQTLLFLDEIQECQAALTTLRYFYEELPELHVIAAGSLLDFVIEKLGLPVGRVQFLYLYPLSFGEFLTALNRDDLRNYIPTKKIDLAIHNQVMEILKTYLWLGGMPAVIDAWLKYKNVELCQNLQTNLIETYKQDFYKYARANNIEYVEKIFLAIPQQLGKKFKFSNIDREIRSIYLKDALLLLEKAGIVYVIYHSSGQEQPLGVSKNSSKFKVYFFDVGLAQRILGLNLKNWITQTTSLKTLGSIAEQFVAEELISYSSINNPHEIFYWHREAKSSNAEIDFLIMRRGQIVPIEVKAGSTGTLRSLQQFLLEHKNSPYGLKIADNLFSKEDFLEQIPLYGIEGWIRE